MLDLLEAVRRALRSPAFKFYGHSCGRRPRRKAPKRMPK
jgi:hypothetical protein